eukprot:8942109-Pyramimonas_sp.AAC.1
MRGAGAEGRVQDLLIAPPEIIDTVQLRDGARRRNAYVVLPIFSQNCPRTRCVTARPRDSAHSRR